MTRRAWLLPLGAVLMAGCSGPSREAVGLAILSGLPGAWLGFGLLRWLLGLAKPDWAAANWAGWRLGLGINALLAVVALVTGGKHLDLGLVPLAYLSSVPSAVAFALLLWRLMWRPDDRLGVWLAPLLVITPYALMGLLLRLHAISDAFPIIFSLYTGFFWAGPAVALALIGLGQLIVQARGEPREG